MTLDVILLICMAAGVAGLIALIPALLEVRWHLQSRSYGLAAIIVEGWILSVVWLSLFVGALLMRRILHLSHLPDGFLIALGIAFAVMPWVGLARYIRYKRRMRARIAREARDERH